MSGQDQAATKNSTATQDDAGNGRLEGHAKTGQGAAAQPSGPKGDNPGTAGPGPTGVRSETPENAKGRLNPSAPEDSNTTPGSTGEK